MVLKSHEVLSDTNVISTVNQNGSCSEASVLHLKWKPRTVSAVRDFPRGCGPILLPASFGSPEATSSSSSLVKNNTEANDAVTDLKLVESLPNGVLKSTENGKTDLIVEEIGDPANEVLKVDDNGGSSIKESTRKMKFPHRRVSAVRDFPPYCGLNATEPTKEERIRINGKRIVSSEDSNGSVKDNSLHKTHSNGSNESLIANQPNKRDKKQDKASQIITKVCEDLVVYTRDNNNPKKKSVIDLSDDDDDDDDSEENHEDESFHNSETNPEDVVPISSLPPVKVKIKNVSSQKKKLSNIEIPKKRSIADISNSGFVKGERIVVMGLMAPSLEPPSITPNNSKSKSKVLPSISPIESKPEEILSITPIQSKPEPIESKPEEIPSITLNESKQEEFPSKKPKKLKSKKVKHAKKSIPSSTYTGTLDMVMTNEEEKQQEEEEKEEDGIPISNEVDVALPPFGPRSSNSARNRIRETLRLFQGLCRKLLQSEEAKTGQYDDSTKPIKRVDLAASKILQEKGKSPNRGQKTFGPVPGVEVGDEFQYRVELALVGIHFPFQGGIDSIKHGNRKVAVSVVASGGYDNEVGKPDCLIYSGSGGIGKDKQIEDQKLERGNIALSNNIDTKIPVRVIRGYKGKVTTDTTATTSSVQKIQTTYIYDGLYTVENYWQEKGPLGNLVFKYELKRIPGQPELAIREVKSKKFKVREGIVVDDITNGKERKRISAINTIDDEKPPVFNYITKIKYPDGAGPPPAGCDCIGRCTGKRCKCTAKNGGEIPYNHNGAIVEAKPLVYECGPGCKCPPSCYNRVTQHGMKIQLEIFKTESRGWGVRALNSISSGSFICEYVGELLEDTEAEKRTGNDEYLFDIGQNYTDTGMGMGSGMGKEEGSGGYTIDALNYGNVGRFINHSCTPNLYAQNVLYDQEDKRMPHIMLFAAENIPPLCELTYHYNYAVDTVHDKDGNIKVKKCFCGSSECTGRLY